MLLGEKKQCSGAERGAPGGSAGARHIPEKEGDGPDVGDAVGGRLEWMTVASPRRKVGRHTIGVFFAGRLTHLPHRREGAKSAAAAPQLAWN